MKNQTQRETKLFFYAKVSSSICDVRFKHHSFTDLLNGLEKLPLFYPSYLIRLVTQYFKRCVFLDLERISNFDI